MKETKCKKCGEYYEDYGSGEVCEDCLMREIENG